MAEDEQEIRGDMSQADKVLLSENLGQVDTNDVSSSGYWIKSEKKSVDENKPENVFKCLVPDGIDNPMKTCANKFIRRTKSVVDNHKDHVEVEFWICCI